MKTTPLTAAIKRLEAWSARHQRVYVSDPTHSVTEDTALVLRALDMLDNAEHVDDRDCEPIFEVRVPCLWQEASRKGLLHCVGVALVDEDVGEGNE